MTAASADQDQPGVAGPDDNCDLRQLVDDLPGMVFRCANEPNWRMYYVSSGAMAVTGYRPDDFLQGRVSYGSLINPLDRDEVWVNVQRAVSDGQQFELVYRIADRTGRERWVWHRGSGAYDKDGRVIAVQGLVSDFTMQRRQAERIRAREELFRLLAENAQDIIFRLSLLPAPRFEYVSPVLSRIIGLTPQDLYEDPVLGLRLVCPEGAPSFESLRPDQIKAESPVISRWTRADGQTTWTENRLRLIYNNDGQLAAIEGIARDVTERTRMEAQLRFLSLHDSLTGLYSRNYFEEEMHRLEGARDYPVTIITTDVDGMKIVNDSLGHRRGDEMLKAYAGVLRATFRRSDVVARIGGDEFAVILPHTDAETAKRLRERLVENVAQTVHTPNGIPLSVSMGSATAEDGTVQLDDVLHRADRAMYRDKIQRSANTTRSIVGAMLDLLQSKDFGAEGHIARVANLTTRMGTAMGLSEDEVANLRLLARVHDLGKVAIPDQTLFKRDPLTEAEREYIEQHCEVGFRIAKASQELGSVAELILHHHEWWNGSGYPSGLAGDSIPVACRILAIADAYDAMTSDRPHRQALTPTEAKEQLKALSGKQFEPAMVDAFLVLLEGPQAAGIQYGQEKGQA